MNASWIETGHLAALTALGVALVQTVAPAIGAKLDRPVWVRVGRQAAFVVFALLTLSSAALIISFLNHDFSVRYVATHASLKLPLFYLATAMWGGHEGSLLLWAWLLSLFSALAAWRAGLTHPRSLPWILMVMGAVLIGFLMLALFLSSPFERLFPVPPDGRDLNPLLQDPGMVFHPPFLYLGYVGFAIPYAFAMAALITRQTSDEWIRATRRWTLFAWTMLTIGIVFGGYWAYYELGWGGYWAWDPVENASFMPWLTATAFLHSVMVQERLGMFRTWNLFLIIATFSLSLLGTFLVRSGVLSSVHAFATDPGRGVFILLFMAAVLIFSFGLLAQRGETGRSSGRMEGLLSRESAFLFNNLFFMTGAATVFLGTLYPLAVETLSANKVTVGPPYFNQVFIPIMLGVLLLMGAGPVIPWRRADGPRLRGALLLPALAGVAAMAVAPLLGIGHPYGIITFGLILFVILTHALDLKRGVQSRRKIDAGGLLTSFGRLISRNKRRYGGLLTHLGLVMMAAGFIGSGLFQQEIDLTLKIGDSTRLGPWSLTFESIRPQARDNWQADEAVVRAVRGDLALTLLPQNRTYNEGRSMPTSEAAIESFFLEDLYVVLGDPVGDGVWGFRLYRNPLVAWVWLGAVIMVLGAGLAMFQGRRLPAAKGG